MENEEFCRSNLLTTFVNVDYESSSVECSIDGRTGWSIREVGSRDLEAVTQLCRDAFPLDYGDAWLSGVCNHRYISFALFHHDKLTSLLVAELKFLSNCDLEDQSIGEGECEVVCYIMSLAVNAAYRRRGCASLLLNHLKATVLDQPPHPKIVFLHVLATNHAAISFYRRNGFHHHSTLPNYYMINGFYHEGYTFVLYVNDRRSWSVKEICSAAAALILTPVRYLIRLRLF